MTEDKQIELIADKITFRGPTVDGGYKITFEVGEYNQVKIAELMKIPQQTNINVKVTYDTR